MRGLLIFIDKVRKCEGTDEEIKKINKELANIRSNFRNLKLNGYNKKKYVCKLIFIFLLGYKCDLGHEQAVHLLLSNIYSEKQIGYLFISVVMGVNTDFMPLIISAIKNDLSSNNEFFQNLALQFVANNATPDLAETLAEQILNVLLHYNTVTFVKQTAALAFLQILRVIPDIKLPESKLNCIADLISHKHLGVAIASASLVDFLVRNYTSCQFCLSHCIILLLRVTTSTAVNISNYIYENTSAPWLTIKLLQILQNFSAPTNRNLKHKLQLCLNTILNEAHKPVISGEFRIYNAKCAIIFEAISLIIHMELDSALIRKAIYVLGNSLNHRKINIRLVALDMMTKLSQNEICLENIKAQWESVFNLLKNENDITIKKRTIDLLYITCDKANIKRLVDEMLHFFSSENNYIDDLVLKIITLAEEFGTNSQWYVDTIFNVLKLLGDIADESIWYKLIKEISNNVMLQDYAAKAAYVALNESPCPDSIVKVAGYILGKYGYLIASNPEYSYMKQFNALRARYYSCTYSARAILLTTYLKFLNLYPDLKDEIQSIFKDKCNSQSENEEIQKRAVEYLKLSEITSKNLLVVPIGEMPPCTKHKSVATPIKKEQNSKNFDAMLPGKSLKMKNLLCFHSYYNPKLAPKFLCERVQMTNSLSKYSLNEVYNKSSNFFSRMNILKRSVSTNALSKISSNSSSCDKYLKIV